MNYPPRTDCPGCGRIVIGAGAEGHADGCVFEECADTLTMFASQLSGSLNGGGDPPSPWRIDDWLAGYRDLYESYRKGDRP